MPCERSDVGDCYCQISRVEVIMRRYLEEDKEPIPIRSIPKKLPRPHYNPSLKTNQRVVQNYVVSVRNMYVGYCLLNRKGLEHMLDIHRSREKAVIKAGSYPYCDGEYTVSHHFDDPKILSPPQTRRSKRKLLDIVIKIEAIVITLKRYWMNISVFEEINPKSIAFNEWTWEAIEFAFEMLYRAFLLECRIVDTLVSSILHTTNFTKLQRCMQTWCEQRGIKDEDLNLIERLLQEVGVKEPEP